MNRRHPHPTEIPDSPAWLAARRLKPTRAKPEPAEPDLWCGHPESAIVTTDGVAWCSLCS